MIVEKQRLRHAFAFVIAGADADRIDISAVIFALRMYEGVSVDLAGARLQDARAVPDCQLQHVDRAQNTGPCGLDRIGLILCGTGRAGQIIDAVGFDVEGLGNVVLQKSEAFMAGQVGNVFHGTGRKIIHTGNAVPLVQQTLAKMRSDEAAASGDQNIHDDFPPVNCVLIRVELCSRV